VNAVEVRGLVRNYGGIPAVHDLDLEVATGECVAILGPNGAGKSTTIEILEGYRHRDGGEVSVLGVDPAKPNRTWRNRIGIVAQSNDDLRDATVREALSHFSRFYDQTRGVNETIALVGLSEKATSRVSTLSGGQRRRLDVGLGVIGRPELLFLDEPTTGFDPEARQQFWQLIEQLKIEGVTVFLTTHYLEEADTLADRVVVIARGTKVADTTPRELGRRNEATVSVHWIENGEPCEERTPTPTAFVAALAARLGGEIPGLEIRRTTLEQAYLELLQEAKP
jgi:ABC-2 type transport system ATP-binding protein